MIVTFFWGGSWVVCHMTPWGSQRGNHCFTLALLSLAGVDLDLQESVFEKILCGTKMDNHGIIMGYSWSHPRVSSQMAGKCQKKLLENAGYSSKPRLMKSDGNDIIVYIYIYTYNCIYIYMIQ